MGARVKCGYNRGAFIASFLGRLVMTKVIFGLAGAVLLLAASTVESAALRYMDWPNGGTCMGGPRDGKWVRDLKFCNPPPGSRGGLSGGARQAAIKKCRKSAGRPIFLACVRNGGSQDNCKSEATPSVRACVRRTHGF